MRRYYIFLILLILIVSLTLYSNTLKNGFVYDDEDTVINSTIIKDLGNLHILFDKKKYFDNSGETSYRPVCTITYFIDYALYELKPWGYHLTNIFLHAVNGILLFTFLMLMLIRKELVPCNKAGTPSQSNKCSNTYALPLLITLLFVTHPALTETVNAISYREDLLVFLFYLITLILYLLAKTKTPSSIPLYAASCLSYILALFSKEMAVTLPLTIYCYEWLSINKDKKSIRAVLSNRYNIGYIAITLLYLFIRFYLFQNLAPERFPPWSLSERLFTIPWLILKYIALMVLPISLSADYKISTVATPFSSVFILSLTVSIFCVGAIFKIKKSERWIALGIALFLITLLPVANFMPIVNPLAERYLYLPAAGFCISLGRVFHLTTVSKRRTSAITLYILLLFFYSNAVVNRNKVWKDNYTLWYDTAKKMPESQQAHYNLGLVYYDQGRLDESIKEYLTVLQYNPNNTMARNNLGNAYDRKGLLNEAISEYSIALQYNPNDAIAHYNLGRAYHKQGRLDDAVKEFLATLSLAPNYARAYYGLGTIYQSQGKIEKSIEAYLNVLLFQPDDLMTHYRLGVLYSRQDRLDDAVNEFRKVLELRTYP